MMMLGRDEIERLAGVVRRQAALHWTNAKAGALVDPFEIELNEVRLSTARDLRMLAEYLDDQAMTLRRAHLSLVK